jgi:hypothetical protein
MALNDKQFSTSTTAKMESAHDEPPQAPIDDDSVSSHISHEFEGQDRRKDVTASATKEQEGGIAAKESEAVRWIRAIAIAVIVFSTAGVAMAVHYYMTGVEKNTFRNRFKSDSHKILESIGSTFDRSLGSIDAYAVGLVTLAKQSNQDWPFVTMSNFPVQSSKILSLSKGIWFVNYHFLPHDRRPAWKNYTARNNAWVEECVDVQENALNKTFFGPIIKNWTLSEDVFFSLEPVEREFYVVVWQQFPVVSPDWPVYNWDYWEYPNEVAKRMLETHRAAISSTYHLPDPNDPVDVEFNEESAEFFRDFIPSDRNPHEPLTEIYYVSSILRFPESQVAAACIRAYLTSSWSVSPF